MKNEFKGFYSLQDTDFKHLWKNATFVFDANVLLNLYRYQESTTEQLIKVIENLKDRIWIPYHVALEYQRNRLKVIANQFVKFSEVRKAIEKGVSSLESDIDGLNLKKRHSTIAPESFIHDINVATKKFLEELKRLESNHFSVTGEDKIRARLDSLLIGNIGSKPIDQKAINAFEKVAEERFKNKTPPGYMDDDKEKSEEPIFSYGDLTYQRKFSDYIIWSQIIEFADKSGLTDLIFITDDNKEDWWFKVKQNGEKTISPRPELIEEITTKTKIQRFHMYSSESFLKYANEELSAKVPKEAIEEVRDLARAPERRFVTSNIGATTERAIYKWLSDRYGEECLSLSQNQPVDIIAKIEGKVIAYVVIAVMAVRGYAHLISKLQHSINRVRYLADKDNFDEVAFVIVTFEANSVDRMKSMLLERFVDCPPVRIIIGTADLIEETGTVSGYVPYAQFGIGNPNAVF